MDYSPFDAAVLRLLAPHDSLSGRDLRAALAREGFSLTGPAFYAKMATLEDRGLVTGWYADLVVAGVAIRERRYRA